MEYKKYYKAIGGALVAVLVAYLTKQGIIVSPELNNALELVIAAAIGFAGVYFAPRNRV